MAQPKMGTALTVKLDPEIHAELERIARTRGIPKSHVVRMLLKAGLEMHQDLEKLGIISVLDAGTALYRWYRERAEKGDIEGKVTE